MIELRDYFAVHAPESLTKNLCGSDVCTLLGRPDTYYTKEPTVAEWRIAAGILRYQWADAMLKARERTMPQVRHFP